MLFLVTLLTGLMVGDRVLALTDQARHNLRLYTELVHAAHQNYGEEVSYQDLVFASIRGLLRTLDPHTSFLAPRAYTGMRERQQESFFGLGILVSMRNGQLTVITPIAGTPASRLGITTGDVISTIEGEPTKEMGFNDAVDRLRGPKGTEVAIEIVRRGVAEPLPMRVTRAEIPQTTVRYAHMLDEETGYLWLTDFNRATGREVADAIKSLKEKGMERLIFDLRSNGGGLLDQAIEVGDQFVATGNEIVSVRGRTDDSIQNYASLGHYPKLDMPVVVLVNRGTASAAEIISGAIQDHDRGLVLGTPTWGKGLVQTVYTLSYGAGMALTTARYYTPSGRLIQRDYSDYFDYLAAEAAPEEEKGLDLENREVFLTDLQRKVYGGGGITPDIYVEPGTLSTFTVRLLTRNAFQNFAVDYSRGREISSEDWRPQTELLDEFQAWLLKEELVTAEQIEEGFGDDEVRNHALRVIAGEILNARFGQEAQHRAMAEGDLQIQKAMEVFDQASDLLAMRQALDADPRRARAVARRTAR